MPSCCVPGCKSRYTRKLKPSGIQFFSFPSKEPARLEQWENAVGRGNWKSTKWSKICSLHFTANDYLPRFEGVIRYLRKNIVPSQMMEGPCNSVKPFQNNLMNKGQLSATSKQSNIEDVQANPQPIGLIRIVHKNPNTVGNEKQAKQILKQKVSNALDSVKRIKPDNVFSSKLPNSIDNNKQTDPGSILPDEATNAVVNEEKTESGSILWKNMSNVLAEEIKTEVEDVPLQNVCNLFTDDHETEIVTTKSPQNICNAVSKEKTTETNHIFSHKMSNIVVKKTKGMIKILPHQLAADQNEASRISVQKQLTNIAPKPINIIPKNKVESPHHSVQILPVAGSDPILALQCPLSNQNTYMVLPIRSLSNNYNHETEVQIDNEETAEAKLPDAKPVLKQKQNFNELSEIDALKREIIKLNRTISRQRKRMQYLVQVRGSKKGHNRMEKTCNIVKKKTTRYEDINDSEEASASFLVLS